MGLARNRVYRAHLETLAEAGAGRGRIHLGGFIENPSALYKDAFAALNFSHSESFSLTCLEACAHGLALVATRCGGPEEIVQDGVTGFLVPVADVDAMAARMIELVEQPARTATMGEAGRRLVRERFGAERFESQLLKIFALCRPIKEEPDYSQLRSNKRWSACA
jgi:glycosyltransferase involved in cell wall biosynthesis